MKIFFCFEKWSSKEKCFCGNFIKRKEMKIITLLLPLLLVGFLLVSAFAFATETGFREMRHKRIHPNAKNYINKRNISFPKNPKVSSGFSFPPLVNLVDTRVGTGGWGFGAGELNPGPTMPYGNMRLGPDTSFGIEPLSLKFQNYAGYSYMDTYLEGFSHTHVVGAGVNDWGNFLVTPIRVPSSSPPPTSLIENAGYKTKFSHDNEIAKPGYYYIVLEEPAVQVELSVGGTHSGIHRYIFYPLDNNGTTNPAILFDICHTTTDSLFGPYEKQCKSAQIYNWTLEPVTKRKLTISATMTMAGGLTGRSPRNGGIVIYFYAELSIENSNTVASVFSDNVYIWEDFKYSNSTASSGSQSQPTTSRSLGLIATILSPASNNNNNGEPISVILRSGISFISPEYAKRNLYHEQQQNSSSSSWKSFDAVAINAMNTWEQSLSRVSISASTTSFSEPVGVFYSSLYITMMAPTTFSEYDGSYLGMDFQIHQIIGNGKQKRFLTELSIWDIYRASNSFMSFLDPEMLQDMVTSMIQMSQQYRQPPYSANCKLPKWPIANIEADCMVGTHSSSILLDFYNKNISTSPAFSFKEVFDLVSECITNEVQSDMPAPGYFVIKDAGTTLEHAIDAATVQYAASRIGNFSVARAMQPYAQSWKNIWEPEHKIPCPRTSGSTTDSTNFDCPTLFGEIVDWIPYPFETRYVEGSAVNYRWYVPQDLQGLFDLLAVGQPNNNNNNANTPAATYLEQFFNYTFTKWPSSLNTTLENAWFDVENEPTMLTPFIYCMMGPEFAHRTSFWIEKILKTWAFYGPFSLGGNQDYSGLTTFFTFAFIGLYPIQPTTNYTVFTPTFDRMTISFPSSSNYLALTILANNRTVGVTNYVSSFSVNGRQILNRAWISHDELILGASVSQQTGQRTAVVEMTLSPVPVSVGNPNIPAWVPSLPVESPEKKRMADHLMVKVLKDFEKKLMTKN
jgi:predicted alpha-1,2-mannosidase